MANRERAFLSACLIVRDEEQNLPRCLESIRGIVDEIIVVDTGSVDKTMQIAESYGAIIHEHPWQHDFSFHRNQSIGYATGEWIFIIDADEEFVCPNAQVLRKFLQSIPDKHNGVGIALKDMQQGLVAMTFNSTRFFRNGTIKYNRRVHNQPTIKGQAVLCPFVHLNHYGYDLNEDQKEKKFERTYSMLLKGLEENSKDYDLLFYLCQLHAEGGRDTLKAIKYGEQYLSHKDEIVATSPRNFNFSIYFTLFRSYVLTKNLEKCKSILEMAIIDIPEDLDIAMGIVEYGILVEDAEVVAEGAKQFLDLYDKYEKSPDIKGGRFTYAFKPEAKAYVLFHYTLCYIKRGIENMSGFMKVLESCHPKVKQGMLGEMQQALNECAIPIHLERRAGEAKPRYTNISL